MSERKTGLPVDPTSSLVSQIAAPFIPVEYETVRPYEVKSSEIDDMGGYTAYREVPGEYRITGFGTPPIVSGGIELFKQFMADPAETAGGIASAVGTELKEYPARQLRTALSGGETFNPETGEIERFDPFAVPATVAAGTAVSIARTADKFGGGPVLAIMGGRNSASGASRENMAKELRRMGKSEDEIFRATQVYFDSDVLGGDTSAFRHEIPNTEKSTLKTGDTSSPVSKYTGDFLYAKDENSFGFKPDVQRYEYDPDAEDLFINDMPEAARFADGKKDYGRAPLLSEMFDFPELFKEYPQLRDVYVVGVEVPDMEVGGKTKQLGGFYLHRGIRGKPTIAIAQARNARDFQSSLLHEIQHAVQAIEHTPGGGEFRRIYDEVKDRLGVEGDSDYVMGRAIDAYEALYGEVEARIVQKRFLNPELKKETPLATRKREAPDDDLVENERDAVDALEEGIREELEYGDVSYEDVYPNQFKAKGGIVRMRRYPERDGPIEGEIQAALKGLAQGATTDLGGGGLDAGAAITGAASEIDPRVQAFSPTASALSAANPFLQGLVDKYGSEALGEAIYGKEDTPLLQKIRDDARLIGGVAGLGEMATAKVAKFTAEGIGDFMRFLPNVRPQKAAAPKSTGLLGGDKPQRFYHGTGAAYKEFDPDAPYTFVADTPSSAEYFAGDVLDGTPNIRPVYLKDANFFDVDNPDHLRQLRESDFYQKNKEKLDGFAIDEDVDFIGAVEAGRYDSIEDSGVIDWMKSNGFDGFTTYEQDGKNYGVFDVKNIVPGVAKKKDGGIVTLADVARNTGRGPMGVASLASTARNMNRPMVS